MKADLSYVPVRSGKLYCAPACGRGCTFEEFDLATQRGAALCAKLGNDIWEPVIHENLGWHFKAVALGGLMVVHQYDYTSARKRGRTEYHAAYCPSGDGVGMSPQFSSDYMSDPRKAVAQVFEKLQEELRKIDSICAAIEALSPKQSSGFPESFRTLPRPK